MALGGVGAGFLAGMLSTLSPCVVPLLPLVVGGAAAAHRMGPLALAAGLAVSFTTVGLFVATIGFSLGIDDGVFRAASAVMLAVIGAVLLSGALQGRFAMVSGGIADRGNKLLQRLSPDGLGGQVMVGLVLGAVWTPCVGPTLGAASLLAAQGQELGTVAATMLAFGLGTAAPLLLIASLSRTALLRWRGRMMGAGRWGKLALGSEAVLVAALILTGLDRQLETALVAASPAWLTNVTTQF
ncbi:MAG TPA: cytochrome c biogenesis protein CcdA [Acetobacteraceae bacterium]